MALVPQHGAAIRGSICLVEDFLVGGVSQLRTNYPAMYNWSYFFFPTKFEQYRRCKYIGYTGENASDNLKTTLKTYTPRRTRDFSISYLRFFFYFFHIEPRSISIRFFSCLQSVFGGRYMLITVFWGERYRQSPSNEEPSKTT